MEREGERGSGRERESPKQSESYRGREIEIKQES